MLEVRGRMELDQATERLSFAILISMFGSTVYLRAMIPLFNGQQDILRTLCSNRRTYFIIPTLNVGRASQLFIRTGQDMPTGR